MCRDTLEIHSHLHGICIIRDFCFLAYVLIMYAVEASPLQLKVMGTVYCYCLLILEAVWLKRNRKEIWLLFLLELLPTAHYITLCDSVVV